MKRFLVDFHTETNWNSRYETIEAENKGDVKSKLREKYGKVTVFSISEVKGK